MGGWFAVIARGVVWAAAAAGEGRTVVRVEDETAQVVDG